MKKVSLLERILDKGMEIVKRPFVIKRVNRAFESAADSIEEQLMGNEAKLNSAREQFVEAAKNEGNLSSHIQNLINLQVEKTSLENAKTALGVEKKSFLEDKTDVEAPTA